MICLSNADRDKIAELLRSHAALLRSKEMRTNRNVNESRIALLLAKKLERKQPNDGGRCPAAKRHTSPKTPQK